MLSLAREDARPLVKAVAAHDEAVQHGAWRQFLRNLDELNLSHLCDDEREHVFGVFAPREEDRIYGRGLRRGWAPMMEHDRRTRMTLSLLFALSGAPPLVAGQEIGTGTTSASRDGPRCGRRCSGRRSPAAGSRRATRGRPRIS